MLRIRPNDLTYYRDGWFFNLRHDEGQQCMTLDVNLGFSRSMTFAVNDDGTIMNERPLTSLMAVKGTMAFSIECPDCLIAAVRQQSAAA